MVANLVPVLKKARTLPKDALSIGKAMCSAFARPLIKVTFVMNVPKDISDHRCPAMEHVSLVNVTIKVSKKKDVIRQQVNAFVNLESKGCVVRSVILKGTF